MRLFAALCGQSMPASVTASIEDERDELMEEISMLENPCGETKKTLETQNANRE